jgi:hypothetical protein
VVGVAAGVQATMIKISSPTTARVVIQWIIFGDFIAFSSRDRFDYILGISTS